MPCGSSPSAWYAGIANASLRTHWAGLYLRRLLKGVCADSARLLQNGVSNQKARRFASCGTATTRKRARRAAIMPRNDKRVHTLDGARRKKIVNFFTKGPGAPRSCRGTRTLPTGDSHGGEQTSLAVSSGNGVSMRHPKHERGHKPFTSINFRSALAPWRRTPRDRPACRRTYRV